MALAWAHGALNAPGWFAAVACAGTLPDAIHAHHPWRAGGELRQRGLLRSAV